MGEKLRWSGVVKVRRIPDGWTEDEFKYMWLPRSVDPVTGIMRIPPRLSQEEKDNLTIATSTNTLLIAGMTTIMSYITGGSPGTMFQYFAVGNGPASGILSNASSLSAEFFRKAITGIVNAGAQATISTLFGSADGVGTWTCGGLFGLGATSTANSGTLISEVLYLPNFSKGSISYTQDYEISLISN